MRDDDTCAFHTSWPCWPTAHRAAADMIGAEYGADASLSCNGPPIAEAHLRADGREMESETSIARAARRKYVAPPATSKYSADFLDISFLACISASMT